MKTQLTKDIKVSVVLLHDAVVGTSSKTDSPNALKELMDYAFQLKNMGNVTGIEPTVKLNVHILKEDLEARGYTTEDLIPRVEPISYSQLVDILDFSKKIVSWM